MKTLDIYIARAVLVGVLVALFVICAVDWLGDLFYQVSRMSGDDRFSDVLIFTLLDIPHKLFEFLPSSMLIGALLSLGQFAASSELVAVGASGYSRMRVGIVSSATGLLITLLLSIFVESYMPYGEKISLSLNKQNNENILLASDQSYWLKDQNRFIRVGQAVSQDLLNDVDIYQFNNQGEIEVISQTEGAIKQQGEWQLQNYRSSIFATNTVSSVNEENYHMPQLFFDNLLQSVASDPFKMSIQRLYSNIFYLEENRLDSSEYQVALFKRFAVPFVGLSMLLLALPLVFRPRQMGGAGQRLLIGIVIALVIYIAVEAITNGAIVFQLSPVIVAFLPVVIILTCSMFAFRFVR